MAVAKQPSEGTGTPPQHVVRSFLGVLPGVTAGRGREKEGNSLCPKFVLGALAFRLRLFSSDEFSSG